MKFTTYKLMYYWECDYCDKQNRPGVMKCYGCGKVFLGER